MNLVQELLREHSKAMCDHVVKHIGSNPKRFEELVNVFLSGPYRVTQRAGWPLSYCVEKHPHLIKPHLKRLINNLRTSGLHNSVKRNTVRFLQFIEVPKSMQGKVVDVCFGFLNDTSEEIAVRVFSMTVLANVAKVQPELRKELRIIIEDQLPYASTGFLSRAKRLLKDLGES